MSNCHICKRELVDDPESLAHNCGGDCLKCMAEAGDSECAEMVLTIYLNQYYDEFSALVEKYLELARPFDTDDIFDVRLQEHSSVYGRK